MPKRSVGSILLILLVAWLGCGGIVIAGAIIIAPDAPAPLAPWGLILSSLFGSFTLATAIGLWRRASWTAKSFAASAVLFFSFQLWWWVFPRGLAPGGFVGPLFALVLFAVLTPFILRAGRRAA